MLTVLYREMQKKSVIKSKFSQTNDKRLYFADEITSLPLFLPDPKELTKLKRKVGQRIDIFLVRENLLKTKNKAQELNEVGSREYHVYRETSWRNIHLHQHVVVLKKS